MYTNVAKPTGTPYTNVRNGYPLFDDTVVSYDDSAIFYDGDSSSFYTNIPKPLDSGTTWGQATITWDNATFPWGSNGEYTNVSKPT